MPARRIAIRACRCGETSEFWQNSEVSPRRGLDPFFQCFIFFQCFSVSVFQPLQDRPPGGLEFTWDLGAQPGAIAALEQLAQQVEKARKFAETLPGRIDRQLS